MKILQTWLVNILIIYMRDYHLFLFIWYRFYLVQEEDAVGLRTRAFARMGGAEGGNISEVNVVISKEGRGSQF